MIDLYSWPTPNGHKVHIMLEEVGLPYRVHAVDIGAGEQFKPDFLAISPNNKIPAIVDQDGPGGQPYSLFESGAILLYLAEKTGKLLPQEPRSRYDVVQWLMFQMGNVGPMLGQAHHFRHYAPEPIDYAINDIATFPWLRSWERQGQNIEDYPNLKRWFEAIAARPAVQRGLEVLADRQRSGSMDEKEREVLFGTTQYRRR